MKRLRPPRRYADRIELARRALCSAIAELEVNHLASALTCAAVAIVHLLPLAPDADLDAVVEHIKRSA